MIIFNQDLTFSECIYMNMSVTLSHFSTCALHVTHRNICCHSPCRSSSRTSYSLSSRALMCNFRVTLLKCYCLFCFLSFLAFFTLTPNDDFAIGPFSAPASRQVVCQFVAILAMLYIFVEHTLEGILSLSMPLCVCFCSTYRNHNTQGQQSIFPDRN